MAYYCNALAQNIWQRVNNCMQCQCKSFLWMLKKMLWIEGSWLPTHGIVAVGWSVLSNDETVLRIFCYHLITFSYTLFLLQAEVWKVGKDLKLPCGMWEGGDLLHPTAEWRTVIGYKSSSDLMSEILFTLVSIKISVHSKRNADSTFTIKWSGTYQLYLYYTGLFISHIILLPKTQTAWWRPPLDNRTFDAIDR